MDNECKGYKLGTEKSIKGENRGVVKRGLEG